MEKKLSGPTTTAGSQQTPTAEEDLTLAALANVLINQLNTPQVQKMIRDARHSTRLEDARFVERLNRLGQVIEDALATE
jgi:hypothetical protein